MPGTGPWQTLSAVFLLRERLTGGPRKQPPVFLFFCDRRKRWDSGQHVSRKHLGSAGTRLSQSAGTRGNASAAPCSVLPTTIPVIASSLDQYPLIFGSESLASPLRRGQFERWFANRAVDRVVMEAGGSAHHWGRWLTRLGIEVQLLPPRYVRPYVRRNPEH
jgi:hypothetical protein